MQVENDNSIQQQQQIQQDYSSLQDRYNQLQQESVEATSSFNLLKTKSTQVLNEQLRIQSLYFLIYDSLYCIERMIRLMI